MALLLASHGQAFSQSQNAQLLFKRAEQTELTAQQKHYLSEIQKYEQYVHHELVVVNIEALESETVLLPIDAKDPLTVNRERLTQRAKNDFSWSGSVAEFDRSSVTIVVNGDMVSANVRMSGDLYSIWPLGEGLHAFTYEDGSRFTDHNEDSYKEIPSYDMQNGWQESRSDNGEVERYIPSASREEDEGYRGSHPDCKIRLLVAYTDDVGAANADPRGQIQLAIDNYNNSSSNSQVNYQVEVARIVEVGYAESGVFSTDRNRFRNTADNYMDGIHDLRSLYDADYCQLVVQNVDPGEGCGLAYGIGVTYGDAFCASRYSCIAGNLTFTHEYAHLHGCRHDP
ncbi:MAG: hypothetical protein JKX84_11265, partial [Flavobacteriales bacterium]|nr:hypothetical protein [Flavobacteriales bacterium]